MKPVSSMHPLLYRLSVFLHRVQRSLSWCFSKVDFASTMSPEPFPVIVVSHKSLLKRKLAGTDASLQTNKIASLRIAAVLIDSVLVKPGEVFSFWKLVGKPSASRGFPPGLQLSFGSLTSMAGGGLCQLTNLLHWMALQTPLVITERHRHATDPFPDYKRKVPFGTGATVFYNYLDFAFRNETSSTFQIKVWLEKEHLFGEIRCEKNLPFSYSVIQKKHRFVRENGIIFRENEVWSRETDVESSKTVSETLLFTNHVEVLYDVTDIAGIEISEVK